MLMRRRRSFRAGVACISDPTTVMRTVRWINRLQRACTRRHGGADDFIAKSFLSAYLMVARRLGKASGERKAFNAAAPMLNSFIIITNIVTIMISCPRPTVSSTTNIIKRFGPA